MTTNFISTLFFGLIILKSCGDSKPESTAISTATEEIVQKIAKVNQLMGDAVGYVGEQPKQFDNFIELEKSASKEELLALTEHLNGVVRCYAFWALSHDTTVNLFPIVEKHILDNEVVSTQFGCVVSGEKVGDFFINVVTPKYVDLSSNKLDSLEFFKLDSILVNSPRELEAKSNAISRANQSEKHYQIVRSLVQDKKDPSAVVALAKYRKKVDISLIKRSKYEDSDYFVFQAIKEFPDPEFLPFLNKKMEEALDDTHYSTEWAAMYNAIANYRNKQALDMLKRPLTEAKVTNIRKYHIDYIFEAVQDNKIPIYDSLLWDLWQTEGKVSISTYNYLSLKDPSQAFLLTKRTLSSSDAMYEASKDVDPESEEDQESLLSIMLQLTIQQD